MLFRSQVTSSACWIVRLSERTLRLKFVKKYKKTCLITSPFKPQLILSYSLLLSCLLYTTGIPHVGGYNNSQERWEMKACCLFLCVSCKTQHVELHKRPCKHSEASCFIQHGKFPFLGIDRSAWKEVSSHLKVFLPL